MAETRYIVCRRCRHGEAWLEAGDEFPSAEVTPAMVTVGLVRADVSGELAAAPAPAKPRAKAKA